MMFSGRLFCIEAVRNTFRDEAARYPLRETGGILLGYHTEDEDIVITKATGPGPGAKHGWRFFEPDTRFCQQQLEAVYRQTKGAITYIGDWHTHPCGGLRPSWQDLSAMLAITDSEDRRVQKPLLWICRPGRSVLCWRALEKHSAWILDGVNRSWLEVPVEWLAAVPT